MTWESQSEYFSLSHQHLFSEAASRYLEDLCRLQCAEQCHRYRSADLLMHLSESEIVINYDLYQKGSGADGEQWIEWVYW